MIPGMMPPPGMPPQGTPAPMPQPGMPMGAPMGGPMGPTGAPGGAPPVDPRMLAMFAQAAQGGGARPGMPPGGQPMPPRPQNPSPPELARMGRNGDQIIAHLTPGEIEVPPEVQTPKVLATLKQAFHKKGVSLPQFVAGSPQASVNPQTQIPEFNIWSALLPALAGGAAAIAAPWALPFLGGLAAPLAAGVASAGASKLTGAPWSTALMTGGLSGLGAGLFPGGLGVGDSPGSGAVSAATNAATPGTSALLGPQVVSGSNALAPAAGAAPGTAAGEGSWLSRLLGANAGSPWLSAVANSPAIGAAGGAGIGGLLFQPPPKPPTPPGLGGHWRGPGGNYQTQLGNVGAPTTPSFVGYDPFGSVAGPNPGYNFFPKASTPTSMS